MISGLLYLYDFINRLSDEKSSFNSIFFIGIIEVQSYLRSFRIIPSLSDGSVFVYDDLLNPLVAMRLDGSLI